MNIPDYVAPIIGYRAWQWNCGGWNPHSAPLKSFNDEWWSPGRALTATCTASFGWTPATGAEVAHGRHEAPLATCTCGIYAAKSFDHLQDQGYLKRGIRGEVYLWGKVIEHQSGWRVQYTSLPAMNGYVRVPQFSTRRHANMRQGRRIELYNSFGAVAHLVPAWKNSILSLELFELNLV